MWISFWTVFGSSGFDLFELSLLYQNIDFGQFLDLVERTCLSCPFYTKTSILGEHVWFILVCMHMHAYACICVHMRTYACMYARICTHTCMHMRNILRVYARICVHMHAYIHKYINYWDARIMCAYARILYAYARISILVWSMHMHAYASIFLFPWKDIDITTLSYSQ